MNRVHYQRSITTMLLCALLLLNCKLQPRDTEEDASAKELPQAVGAVLSRGSNGSGDLSPGSPLPMPLGSGGIPLSVARSTRPNTAQLLDGSGPSSGMQRVVMPVPALAFGREAWAQYFGDVGEAPPLPEEITAILDSPCPFWKDRRVRDTHLLTLIPAKVGGRDFSLNLLGELINKPQNGGHRAQYCVYNEDMKRELGVIAPSSSYWVLMARDVLPNSRSLTATGQSSLVTDHASKTGLPYELPTALEAVTTILMHYARTGERLFTDNPHTYTCCHGFVSNSYFVNRRYGIYTGNFGADGLFINCIVTGVGIHSYALPAHGVAACRKL